MPDQFQSRVPTFNEVLSHTETGPVRKGLNRYFFSRNPERSIERYKRLGIPTIKSAVMRTAGKLKGKSQANSNYRIDTRNKSRLDAVADFASKKSIFNEVAHTVATNSFATTTISQWAERGPELHTSGYAVAALGNLALVALQRYNRARAITVMDSSLRRGKEFSPDYENWLGIDFSAITNYHNTQPEHDTSDSPPQVTETASGEQPAITAPPVET